QEFAGLGIECGNRLRPRNDKLVLVAQAGLERWLQVVALRWTMNVRRASAGRGASGDRHRRWMSERLVHHAIPLGQAQQCGELIFGSVALEHDLQTYILEADRHFLGQTERASEIEIAFGAQRRIPQLDPERR